MNRDLIDLALVSAIVGLSADPVLAGAIFIYGATMLLAREIARLTR